VRVFSHQDSQPIVAMAEPCVMTGAWPDTDLDEIHCDLYDSFREALNWADVLAIGPGLGTGRLMQNLLGVAMSRWNKPIVLDADALNLLSEYDGGPTLWRGATCHLRGPAVITPHPGEMRRLLKAADLPLEFDDSDELRIHVASQYAALDPELTVVLKGRRTVVANAEKVFVNESGNSGMASGGMGDVLTGLIAALIGQGLSSFDAACRGVWQHGAAADRLATEIGPMGFLASDVAAALPRVL
jgi:hydroxyethylthiazole kinase-like uncharacterized protein yjeF